MRWARRRGKWWKWAGLLLVVSLLALNLVAWMQVRSMTHFVESGSRTARPEELSLPEKAWVLLTGVTVPRPTNSITPSAIGLEYETHTLIAFDDLLEAWYIPADGQGIVLMFPGYAQSKESLLAAAREVHSLGWDTLLVDFRGVGGSGGSNTTLGVREAADVAAAVSYARSEWPGKQVVLYGVSMGSAAVLRAVAEQNVEIEGLILESPFDNLVSTVRNRFAAMGLPGWPGAELVVFWGGVQMGTDGFAHNPVDYAPSVRVPTLLMHGENDPRATMAEARSVHDALAGEKWFRSFPGAGHESLLEVDRELWREEIERFLAVTAQGN